MLIPWKASVVKWYNKIYVIPKIGKYKVWFTENSDEITFIHSEVFALEFKTCIVMSSAGLILEPHKRVIILQLVVFTFATLWAFCMPSHIYIHTHRYIYKYIHLFMYIWIYINLYMYICYFSTFFTCWVPPAPCLGAFVPVVCELLLALSFFAKTAFL